MNSGPQPQQAGKGPSWLYSMPQAQSDCLCGSVCGLRFWGVCRTRAAGKSTQLWMLGLSSRKRARGLAGCETFRRGTDSLAATVTVRLRDEAFMGSGPGWARAAGSGESGILLGQCAWLAWRSSSTVDVIGPLGGRYHIVGKGCVPYCRAVYRTLRGIQC